MKKFAGRTLRWALAAVIATAGIGAQAVAAELKLSADQEVPPVTTMGSGTGTT